MPTRTLTPPPLNAPKAASKPTTNQIRHEIPAPPQRLPIHDRPEWIDCRRVKSLFTLSRSTIYRLADEGKIRTLSLRERGHVRGKRLFGYDSIVAFLNARATGGENTTHPTA
jgi:hypothetical protein